MRKGATVEIMAGGWEFPEKLLAKQLILGSQAIAIMGHRGPDGDCIGSALSLAIGISKLGKQVYCIAENIPDRYRFLPGMATIQFHPPDRKFDLAIALDCAASEMLEPAGSRTFFSARRTLEIDHHEVRHSFADISLVDPDASAVGELIYFLLKELNVPICTNIAENILTSILIETNSFQLPSVHPGAFEIAAALLRCGVDYQALTERLFLAKSRKSEVLAGICLSRAIFSCNDKLVWSIITLEDMKAANADESDADPVAEKLRAIHGVNIAILFRERDSRHCRVSFRSKQSVNVAYLATLHGGGGHRDVAGCIIANSARERLRLIRNAEQYLRRNPAKKESGLAGALLPWRAYESAL